MILFLDTVSPLPQFSLIQENKVIYSIHIISKKSNKISDSIVSSYIDLKKKINIENKIEKLIVCTGPGSYTALRVGISFMYGLSLSLKKKLLGIGCADLLHQTILKSEQKKTIFFICSSNNQFFYCKFLDNNKLSIQKFDKELYLEKNKVTEYTNCVSNSILPSDIRTSLDFKSIKVAEFANIISLNTKKISSLCQKNVIEPIYISNNNPSGKII